MEAAREEQFFRRLQAEQIAKLKDHHKEEIEHHKKHIKEHEKAIKRHKEKIQGLKPDKD